MTEMGVYVVDDTIFSAREAYMKIEGLAVSIIQPRPMDEILYIASVVAQHQFPVDIVNNILEFAGVVLVFQVHTYEFHGGHSNMNEDYLQLPLPAVEQLEVPPGVDVTKCSLLVADCVSKDQGWATDHPEYNGTYFKSSSWCEVAVVSVSAEGESKETARVPFCPNLRANMNYRHHRKYFDSSTDLLQKIKLGDCVSIVLRSEYPGWTNSAKYGWLAACFAVEITDDFSFAEIPFPNTSEPFFPFFLD